MTDLEGALVLAFILALIAAIVILPRIFEGKILDFVKFLYSPLPPSKGEIARNQQYEKKRKLSRELAGLCRDGLDHNWVCAGIQAEFPRETYTYICQDCYKEVTDTPGRDGRRL